MNKIFDCEECRPFSALGSRQGILLIHGFTGTCAHMRPLAEELAAMGYTVRTFNLPGHATCEEDMRKSDWQQWLHAARQQAHELRSQTDHLAVAGLSMGGLLALILAQQMDIDLCVPISTPMAVQNRLLPFAGIAAPFKPRIEWKKSPERHLAVDKRYDYGYAGFPTAKGSDLFKLIKTARRNLFSVHCPVLCIQSNTDEIIRRDSAQIILDGVSSERRLLMGLDGLPHVLTLTRECKTIAKAIHTQYQLALQA